MTDPVFGGKEIKYAYDENDRLISIEHPDGSEAHYEYYGDHCLSGVWDESGKSLIYSYDEDKRIVKISEHSYAAKNTKPQNEKKRKKQLDKLVKN